MKTTKTKAKNKKSISKFFIAIGVCFLSILSFAACNPFGKSDGGSTKPTHDDKGRLRIDSPYVVFNNFKNDGSKNTTDSTTGSFSWTHKTYFNTSDGKDDESEPLTPLHPDYDIVVDGIHYSFKINADLTVSYLDVNDDDNDNDFNEYLSKTDTGYDPEYFKINPTTNIVTFNPRLEKGSISRQLKVRAISKESNSIKKTRGDSLYSNIVSFKAYTFSFEAYSANSVDLDYTALQINDGFYFHTTKESSYASGTYSKLTGTFPEGRQIVVTRTNNLDNSNYAFQKWTMNTKAENTYLTSSSVPTVLQSNSTITNLSNSESTKTCIPKAESQKLAGLSEVNVSNTTYDSKSCFFVDNGDILAKEYIETKNISGTDNSVSNLVVVSHSAVNAYTFYGNYAKVRNFTMSGTFFAGDNLFTNSGQYLTGVAITLFDADGKKIIGSSTVGAKFEGDRIELTVEGSYFKLTGLAIDEFVIFELEGKPLLGGDGFVSSTDKLSYSFHNPLMEKDKYVDYFKDEKRVLSLKTHNDDYGYDAFSDRQDIGIIGTQYAETTNLQINMYQTTTSGDQKQINSSQLKLLSDGDINYEVVKSVSSYEDKEGYITTNVIISFILPSNQTLIGYNVETVNNRTRLFYKGGTNYYLAVESFNPETMQAKLEELRQITVSSISDGITIGAGGEYVEYNGVAFVFNRKDGPNKYFYDTLSCYDCRCDKCKCVGYLDCDNCEGVGCLDCDKCEGVGYLDCDNCEGVGYLGCDNCDKGKILSNSNKWSLLKDGSSWSLVTYELCEEFGIENGNYVHNGNTLELAASADAESFSAIETEALTVSSLATGYLTEMKHEEQSIYVCYDTKSVKSGGITKTYYTAPIAKDMNAINGGSVTEKTSFYFPEISNFGTLENSDKIMLGSEIYGSGIPFEEIMGAKLIPTCYYYVAPVTGPTTLKVKQYVNSNKSNGTETVYVYKYKNDGAIHTGKIYPSHKVNEELVINIASVEALYSEINAAATSKIKEDYTSESFYVRESHVLLEKVKNKYHFLYQLVDDNYELVKKEETVNIKIEKGTAEPTEYEKKCFIYNNNLSNYLMLSDQMLYFQLVDGSFVPAQVNFEGITEGSEVNNLISIYDTYLAVNNSQMFKANGYGSDYKYVIENINNKFKVGYELVEVNKYTCSINRINIARCYGQVENEGDPRHFWFRYINKSQKINLSYFDDVSKTVKTESYIVCELDDDGIVFDSTYMPLRADGDSVEDNNAIIRYILPTYYIGTNAIDVFKVEPTFGDKMADYDGFYAEYDVDRGFKKDTELTCDPTEVDVAKPNSEIVRSAQIATGEKMNDNVTLLGRYILTSDEPIIYPSYSSLTSFDKETSSILNMNKDGEFNYYSLDYTSKNNVIEGFPGVKLLAGPPYPNPVLYLQIRHKASETPTVNISLDVKDAYFVEVFNTFMQT